MKISKDGIEIIKYYESLRLDTYICSGGKLTIGYGHTGSDVKQSMIITPNQAEELLINDLNRFEKDVTSLVKVAINQNQFDALVCFAFNVGSDIDLDKIAEGLGDSTLLAKLNAGDFIGATKEFPKWNKSKGLVTKGLVRRRATEKAFFEGNSLKDSILAGKLAAP